MLQKISNLGTTLNKSDQQSINGGKYWCLKYFACIDQHIDVCQVYIEPCPS
ncbi:protein of unknown function [Tenacibaculum sp. 190130A14a]|uniref:Uncharacterized protein n=1 Tax=Tenacibaculum polynesiense TaxID=3137857 RepID=A0ABP1EZH3_9FLAO